MGIDALCLVIYVQRDSLTAAKERAETAKQITGDRDGTIKTLTDAAAKDKKAAAKLQAATGADADSHPLSSDHALQTAGDGVQN
ncbi:hypothetical protein [Collimonas humicola]|uniref:hypothetical protein n=1 Tax=Collimonas humicola TaxID=2825886 RepID=UPI001B8D48AE|nr:hypothetical protein [Collimonas humicola]